MLGIQLKRNECVLCVVHATLLKMEMFIENWISKALKRWSVFYSILVCAHQLLIYFKTTFYRPAERVSFIFHWQLINRSTFVHLIQVIFMTLNPAPFSFIIWFLRIARWFIKRKNFIAKIFHFHFPQMGLSVINESSENAALSSSSPL